MKLRTITQLAAVCAAYVVLTYLFGFMSYGDVQFDRRTADPAMFLRRDYAIRSSSDAPSPTFRVRSGIVDVAFGQPYLFAASVSSLCRASEVVWQDPGSR